MSAIKMHEPWRYSDDKEWIVDSYGDEIVQTEEMTEAQTDRIVACVNAMAGIPDPAAFVKAHGELVEAANVALGTLSLAGLVPTVQNRLALAIAACAQQEKKV